MPTQDGHVLRYPGKILRFKVPEILMAVDLHGGYVAVPQPNWVSG
jgi:hypothetical protein